MTYPREKEYAIRDIDGNLIAAHVKRVLDDKGNKRFLWWKPGEEFGLGGTSPSDLPLYRSENLRDWAGEVVITEGEGCADTLALLGWHALGTVTGASSTPSVDVLETLQGHDVVLWPDNDDVGRAHMERIADILYQLGVPVKVVHTDLNDGSDVSDLDDVDLITMTIEGAEPYVPKGEGEEPKFWTINGLDALYTGEVDRRMTAKLSGHRANLLWGFERLDNITDGLQSALICLHAQPGVGKTAFALQVASKVDAPVLYVTAEMGVLELTRRLVAQIGNRTRRELMSASMSVEEENESLRKTLSAIPHMHFLDATIAPARPKFIGAKLDALKRKDPNGHALLVIDSLHTWVEPLIEDMPDGNEYKGINYAMKALRAIEKKCKVPVLFIAERNRAGSIKGSMSPEYRSDIVLSLERPKDDDGRDVEFDPMMPHEVNLSVLKNRNGPPGSVLSYIFDGDHQRFREV